MAFSITNQLLYQLSYAGERSRSLAYNVGANKLPPYPLPVAEPTQLIDSIDCPGREARPIFLNRRTRIR
jgi:hypothetical protein